MIFRALKDVSLEDFLGLSFAYPKVINRDSIAGEELVADESALNQWRYAMDSINQNQMTLSH